MQSKRRAAQNHDDKASPPIRVIGLMSGTSGDGVGAALVELSPAGARSASGTPLDLSAERPGDRSAENQRDLSAEERGEIGEQAEAAYMPDIRLVASVTLPYDEDFKERLFALFHSETARLDEICRMNVLLAEEFAKAARTVTECAGVMLHDVDLIGSHGQTICHLPPVEETSVAGGIPSTLQIGSVSTIAELTGVTTVGDFRLRDMAVGGEGAPLVPICDWALFQAEDKTRAVQNIGGMANVTVLPKGATMERIVAFDTGPGNALIDEAVRHITGGAEEFDRDGLRAARGHVDEACLEAWLQHQFFSRKPPKSTGREAFGAPAARKMIADAEARGVKGDDLVATLTRLTSESIVRHYEAYVIPKYGLDEVIIGGGGAHNRTLIRWISERLPGTVIRTHEDYGIPSEAKEPIAFALLAYLFMTGQPGNVPAATGATKPVVLGVCAPGAHPRRSRTMAPPLFLASDPRS